MNYYNEIDHNAAEWLRELISSGLIPDGDVDERSIIDVQKDDLRGYTQCHFFAGIGGWSLALKLSGWPEDRPVWTGSCPCQPYSTAGKQRGNADERDLWPAFFRLIAECNPEFVFGEQVENAIRHGWLDRVYTDLEGEGYSVGAAVLGAHSVGAPHRRYRLYWGGVSVPHAARIGRNEWRSRTGRRGALSGCGADGMADPYEQGSQGWKSLERPGKLPFGKGGMAGISPWGNSKLILCRDGKTRRVPAESLLFGMADGISEGMDKGWVKGVSETEGFPLTKETEGRVMLLRGYGNAIVPQVASEFVKAFMGN